MSTFADRKWFPKNEIVACADCGIPRKIVMIASVLRGISPTNSELGRPVGPLHASGFRRDLSAMSETIAAYHMLLVFPASLTQGFSLA